MIRKLKQSEVEEIRKCWDCSVMTLEAISKYSDDQDRQQMTLSMGFLAIVNPDLADLLLSMQTADLKQMAKQIRERG